MKYKLFISDYDGTLGEAPANDIDSETLNAINEYIEKGGIFVVCSGRETSSIMRILKKHDMKGLVASLQGAKISDIESGEYLFSGGLDTESAICALDAVEDTGLIPLIYHEGKMYYEEYNPYIGVYEKAVGHKGKIVNVKEQIKEIGEKICKICWLGEDDLVTATAKRLNEKFNGKGIKFNSGARCLLEAINPDCGKGNAVRFLAEHFNIPLEQVTKNGKNSKLLVGKTK